MKQEKPQTTQPSVILPQERDLLEIGEYWFYLCYKNEN